MVSNGSFFFVDLYASLCVLMVFNGFLWVLIGLYSFLRCLVGPSRSICVFMESVGFLWVLIGFDSFLWVLIRSYASL